MKFLILMILVSCLPANTYATDELIDMKESIDITGIQDQELINIERELEEVKIYNRNGTKKVDKLNKVQQHVSELIPKQIELAKDRRSLNKVIDLKNKYINCISTKDEEDCSDLKEDLEKLNIKSSSNEINAIKSHVVNPVAMAQIRKCSEVTQEFFPDFQAVVRLDISLDTFGNVQSVYIDQSESEISHDLPMFSRCVVHFARKLQFYNPTGNVAKLQQDLFFGQI